MSNPFYFNPFFDDAEPEPILRDVFDYASGEGIFSALATAGTMPWSGIESIDDESLDLEYFANHSGGKFCAPLVKSLLKDGKLDESARSSIAKILISKYLYNWQRLWDTNVVKYEPIHNYNMYETRNLVRSEDEKRATEEELKKTGTDTLQHGLTETTTHGHTTDELTSRYGLNTVDIPKPSDDVKTTEGGTTKVVDSGDDVTTHDTTDTNNVTETRDNDGMESESTHRYGNIGVTTSQKMLADEREVWMWNFFDQVFADLDKELTLAFHDPCRV